MITSVIFHCEIFWVWLDHYYDNIYIYIYNINGRFIKHFFLSMITISMSMIIIYHWLDWYKGNFTGNHRSIHWIYFSCRFSLKPIHWIIINHDQPLWFTMASPRTDNPNDFRTPHGWSPRSFSPRGPRRVEHLATGPAPNGKISGKIGENLWGWASATKKHGSLNVPIEHHPTIRCMVYNGYYKVMSNIPKMGQLPTPDHWGWASQKKVTPSPTTGKPWCDSRTSPDGYCFQMVFFSANWAPKYNVLSGLIEKWWEMHCQLFSPFIAS